jgi:type II secretory pathway pseudopilin PulG
MKQSIASICRKGLSFAEILWAVVIMGFIIVTVTSVFNGLLVSSKKTEKKIVATNLAIKQMENIKLMGFTDIVVPKVFDGKTNYGEQNTGSILYFPPYPYPQPGPLYEIIDGVKYYFKITTSYVPSTGNNLIDIIITVYWEEKNTGNNSISLELYKAR